MFLRLLENLGVVVSAPVSGNRVDPPEPVFLTVDEIAARWRVSRMTVYRMIHAGDLPCMVLGKTFRVNLKAVLLHERYHG